MSAVQKARKKPVEIEFIRWHGGAELATPIIDWILENGGTATWDEEHEVETPLHEWGGSTPRVRIIPEAISIRTLEGTMTASVGDVVIRGVQGEFYPCKPDIFEQTYDLVS